ncbi:MAG TPA: hypothetical protein VLX92_21520 [Kofleriaceae bacterium]|nr:hypothetical protein [Kofleriaceae bacterium]
MREARMSFPELALVAGTRGLLGLGLGLLLSSRFGQRRRRAIGWTLFGVGALSSIPLAFEIFGKGRLIHRNGKSRAAGLDEGISAD